jgi:hypothetical protein
MTNPNNDPREDDPREDDPREDKDEDLEKARYLDPSNGNAYLRERFSWKMPFVTRNSKSIYQEIIWEMIDDNKAGCASLIGRLIGKNNRITQKQFTPFSLLLPKYRAWEDIAFTGFIPILGFAINYVFALLTTGLEIGWRYIGKALEKPAKYCWEQANKKENNWFVRIAAGIGAVILGLPSFVCTFAGKCCGYIKRTVDAIANIGPSMLTAVVDPIAWAARKLFPKYFDSETVTQIVGGEKTKGALISIRQERRYGNRYPTLWVCAQAFLKGLSQILSSPVMVPLDRVVNTSSRKIFPSDAGIEMQQRRTSTEEQRQQIYTRRASMSSTAVIGAKGVKVRTSSPSTDDQLSRAHLSARTTSSDSAVSQPPLSDTRKKGGDMSEAVKNVKNNSTDEKNMRLQ